MPTLPDGMTCRKLEPSDYHKGILSLLQQLTVVGDVTEADFAARVIDMQAAGIVTLVLEHEDRVVGSASLVVEPKLIHSLGNVGHVEDVVIHDSCRGQRLGEWLLRKLAEVARDKHCYKVILDCSEENAGFYEKCGYHKSCLQMRLDVPH